MISRIKPIPLLLSLYIVFNPFLIYLSLQNPYEFPKFIFSVITAQIIAILLLLRNVKIKYDLLTKLILIYLLIVLLANIFGMDFRTSLAGSAWRHQGFLLLLSGVIFYLASRFGTNKKYIETSIIFSGIILSIITIIEFILLNAGHNFPTYNGRVVATLGNPNFLGAYLAMTLPFILLSKYKNNFLKIYLSVLICISALITHSRSALIAIFIVILIFLIHKLKINNYLKILLIFISGILFILIITQASFLQRSSIYETRTLIWNIGIEKIAEKPILGIGQENFELIFPKSLNYHVDNAHNLFLETIISSGALGLIMLLSIIIVGFKKAKFKYKLFLLAFIITSFFNPLFITGIILFWIVLGTSNSE